MIRVVAVASLGNVRVDGPVYLRTEGLLKLLPGLEEHQIAATFDEELARPAGEAPARIAAVLEDASTDSVVTYVVPGFGPPGDATVAAINPTLISSIEASPASRAGFGVAGCMVVDALSLAIAENEAPFDRGLVPMDPTWPVVVTNWYGNRAIKLAARRLKRFYGDIELPKPTAAFELHMPPVDQISPVASFSALEQIASRLRRADGCPWDREQTSQSLFPMAVEELQELGEAIEKQDIPNVAEELGDVLFHLILQTQIGTEAGTFTMDDVLREATAKMVRRHPHVFGDVVVETYEDVLKTWQNVKEQEKAR